MCAKQKFLCEAVRVGDVASGTHVAHVRGVFLFFFCNWPATVTGAEGVWHKERRDGQLRPSGVCRDEEEAVKNNSRGAAGRRVIDT
ncbi:unnamed protein product [Caenorhabditis auriculariae]|uniref:Uncharacterized protein n=1 Tax=Caenorhabditis auriculariae TaxID=2777116 RepID=A0A8S1HSL1_9PELO|nr:unnamed protein product [Caenorhabditis auriculariae]